MFSDSLAEQLLFCTVRIEAWNANVASVGTGFLYSKKIEGKGIIPFLVTNRHVVEGYSEGKIRFTLKKDGQPILGEYYEKNINNFDKSWIFHKDKNIDLAMMPLMFHFNDIDDGSINIFTRNISSDLTPSKELIESLDAIEDVLFIGYPNGLWDSLNNLPIIRKGITATPISVEFEKQPIFLIDGSVFNGSSGSPVFIYNKGTIIDRRGNVTIGSRLLFLGVLSAVYYKEEFKILEMKTTKFESGIQTSEMLDLGIVYKSRLIDEMITSFITIFMPK